MISCQLASFVLQSQQKGGDLMKSKRLIYGLIFLFLLVTEVCIALFVHDRFIRPYFGDVLVTVLICAFCRIFVPQGIKALPIYVFLFATVVEIAQYFKMVKLLGLEDSRFFSTLLGTSFSVYDLICYAAGCLLAFGISWVIDRRIKK